MKIPPIDLSEVIKILKKEGGEELSSTVKTPGANPFGINYTIMTEWNNIIRILEFDLIPQLAKGGDISSLLPAANALKKSVGSLTLMASQVLSFIPGPIGIICSIINAIVCFASGNIVGGLLELLGCIPGAKLGVKGGSKLFTKIGDKVIILIEKNPELAKALKNWEKIKESAKVFTKDLNFSKIKEITNKIQKEITDIEKNIQKPIRQFDTGQTYKKMNFEHLSIKNKGIGDAGVGQLMKNGKQIQNRGISINGIGYGLSPQTIIKPW